MTIDEAIKMIKIQMPVYGCKEYKKPLMYAYEIAIKALEKQEKYRWHDLRKDPDDLPDNENEVDIAFTTWNGKVGIARAFYEDGTMHSEDSMMGAGVKGWDYWCEYCEETDDYIIPAGWLEYVCFGETYTIVDREVIAWREIEPFEREVEE